MFKSLLPWKPTKTKVMVPEQTMEDDPALQEQPLVACNTCGRTFLPQPLKKHAPICEKSQSKRRKVFDSLKQRIEGTDLAQFHQKSYLKKQQEPPKPVEKPKKQWQEDHQKLVDAIRFAKESREMSLTSKKVATSPSNERCPHCERQFGPKAFDRHVEWCKEHSRTRVQKSPANVLLAKERLEARTKYKVPPLNKPKRLAVKEKYSTGNFNRTESVCSVKSTPTSLFRSPSVRKPNPKKPEVPKVDKAKSVLTLSDVKKKEQKNVARSKRYCPPRDKINSIHTENLESITVCPMKLVTKKLVTWKEIGREKSDEVIVVYDNSGTFQKKESPTIERAETSKDEGVVQTKSSPEISNVRVDKSSGSSLTISFSSEDSIELLATSDQACSSSTPTKTDVEPSTENSKIIIEKTTPITKFISEEFRFEKASPLAVTDSPTVEYEVPKKRRKLNSTFVLPSPKIESRVLLPARVQKKIVRVFTKKEIDGRVFRSYGEASFGKKEGKKQTTNKENGKKRPEMTFKPEDLFAVDDKMYAEYKIYEEMYLKEKEQLANSKKHRTKNTIVSYGIDLNERGNPTGKVSDDSAYGRGSPVRRRVDSGSSSGSEPVFNPNQRMSKFCHECGSKYPLATAKFCVECGVKRLLL